MKIAGVISSRQTGTSRGRRACAPSHVNSAKTANTHHGVCCRTLRMLDIDGSPLLGIHPARSIPELDGDGFGLVPNLESRVREAGRTRRVTIGGEPIDFRGLARGIGIEPAVLVRIVERTDRIFAGRDIPERVADVSLRRLA